jgi:lysophospholipase L1-like esterase
MGPADWRGALNRALAFLVVLSVSLALPGGGISASSESVPPFPNSIAAIGDSISQAADVCCFYGDHPHKSWTTGDDPSDPISSHYERIRGSNPGISGNNYNDSVSGARMADAPGQATLAVAQKAEYVTILMGGNDVCTSTIDTMTSVEDFRGQFEATMEILDSGLPAGAHIFVSSIPNIYRLWQIFHTNPVAQLVWAIGQICQSMLSPSNTESDRQAVLRRERAFNGVLGQVCGQYANCMYDGGAVFAYDFTRKDVTKLDYFHPSVSGQANLARVTWAASWWPGTDG